MKVFVIFYFFIIFILRIESKANETSPSYILDEIAISDYCNSPIYNDQKEKLEHLKEINLDIVVKIKSSQILEDASLITLFSSALCLKINKEVSFSNVWKSQNKSARNLYIGCLSSIFINYFWGKTIDSELDELSQSLIRTAEEIGRLESELQRSCKPIPKL